MTGFLEGLAARAAGRAAEAPVKPWSGPRFLPDDLGVGTASPDSEPGCKRAWSEPDSAAPGPAVETPRQREAGPRTVQGPAPERSAGEATAGRRSPSVSPDPQVTDEPAQVARAARPATRPEHPATVLRTCPAPNGEIPAPSPPRRDPPQAPSAPTPRPSARRTRDLIQAPLRPPAEPRIEVHIGRIELRAPRPPQPPPRPAPARSDRDTHVHGFDRLATARRYVDRTPR